MSWNDADLADLRAKVADRAHTEAAIAADVAHLRREGCPWSLIAEELGVTKQAAHERYSPKRPAAVRTPDPDQLTID